MTLRLISWFRCSQSQPSIIKKSIWKLKLWDSLLTGYLIIIAPIVDCCLGLQLIVIAKWSFLFFIKNLNRGFPGGAVVESLPANAGDTGSSPGLGGSHMPRSGWARGPQLLSLRVWSLCPATGGAAVVKGPRTAMRSGPRLP